MVIAYCGRKIDPYEFVKLLISEGGWWSDSDPRKGYGGLDVDGAAAIWLDGYWDVDDPDEKEITDEEERQLCMKHTDCPLRSVVAIQVGHSDGSMELAMDFASKISERWPCVCIDDAYEWPKILKIPGCYYYGKKVCLLYTSPSPRD